jgi:CRP-like cAMP-binding protein
MPPASASPARNLLLASLDRRDLRLLEPHLEPATLALRHVLEEPGKPVDAVYFPEEGFASVVAGPKSAAQVEVGLIGRDGMSGLTILLGNHSSPHSTYMQAAGKGQRVRTAEFRKAMQDSASLRQSLLKYVQVFMIQTAQTAIANARARLDQRLARWILMADDRLEGASLPLTHEFLSLMLGVRRASVTEAIAALEAQNLIRARRAQIVVLNRKGIERKAGTFYGTPEAEHRRLIG